VQTYSHIIASSIMNKETIHLLGDNDTFDFFNEQAEVIVSNIGGHITPISKMFAGTDSSNQNWRVIIYREGAHSHQNENGIWVLTRA